MQNLESVSVAVVLLVVVLGTLLLLLSVRMSLKVQAFVPEKYSLRWRILTVLICFFVTGYCGYLLIYLSSRTFPLEYLVAAVFLGGAIFVYGVIDLARSTIGALHENTVNLEHRIAERTGELVEINKRLEQSQRSLHEKNVFLETVLESLTHPFYVIDVNTHEVVLFNKAAGFADKKGCTCYQLTHDRSAPCSARKHPCPIKEIQKNGKPVVLEHVHLDKNGDRKYVEIHGYPIFDEHGELVQVIEYAEDITARKQVELKLVEAKQEAERASMAKNEFLANVSHEIRTPMNAILGMTDLVLATELNSQQRNYLETVKGSSDLLLNLLNDILDFSKIEAGRFHLDHRPFTVAGVIAAVIPPMKLVAEEKGLEFTSECRDRTCNRPIQGDDLRFRQVLNNLVGNALKFTERGYVKVTCECAELGDATVEVTCQVEDSGIGIDSADYDRIFESFTQVETGTVKSRAGTGLGLAISKYLVGLMGGKIRVESKKDEGSKFTFTTVFEFDDTPPGRETVRGTNEELDIDFEPMRILVVDDIQPNRDLARMILEQQNHETEEAENGMHALEMLAKSRYDAVLLDIQMPGMDGLQTANYIRKCEQEDIESVVNSENAQLLREVRERLKGGHLPLVALTARATTDDREKCLAAGMDAYVSKPFRQEEILRGLAIGRQKAGIK